MRYRDIHYNNYIVIPYCNCSNKFIKWLLIISSELQLLAQLSQADGILYLDIPRPEFPVDVVAGGYGPEGEAYEEEYYKEGEAYGFAS